MYQGYGPAGHGQAVEIKDNGKKYVAERVNEMARREVAGVAATLNEYRPLVCGERMHHDLSRIPIAWDPDGEQHGVPIGQQLWAVNGLRERNNELRCPAGGRYAQNAPRFLSNENCVVDSPTHVEDARSDVGDHYGRAAADGDAFDLL